MMEIKDWGLSESLKVENPMKKTTRKCTTCDNDGPCEDSDHDTVEENP